MPLRPSLLSEIETALGSALTPNLTAASAGSDLFEAYVFTLILRAATEEGATVTFENVDGNRPQTFTFRTSPGQIWWDARPYTHAVLSFAGKPSLEVHLGVYIAGKSGVFHEADLAVLFRDEAQTCRQNGVPPRSARVLIATECKFYSTTPGLGLARGFVGLCSDLTSRDCYFVMNSTSNSVEKLLAHKRKNWEHQVFPSSTGPVLRLRNSFQHAFKNFKVRY